MKYVKKCPKCGRYMTPYLQSNFGYVSVLWSCHCGYSKEIGDARADYITTDSEGGTTKRFRKLRMEQG